MQRFSFLLTCDVLSKTHFKAWLMWQYAVVRLITMFLRFMLKCWSCIKIWGIHSSIPLEIICLHISIWSTCFPGVRIPLKVLTGCNDPAQPCQGSPNLPTSQSSIVTQDHLINTRLFNTAHCQASGSGYGGLIQSIFCMLGSVLAAPIKPWPW